MPAKIVSLSRKRYERALDAERRCDLDAAVTHFESLVADPCGRGECPDAGLRLGRLYARRLEPARAVETLAKALEATPGARAERMLLLEQYRDLFLVEQATGPRHARQKLMVRAYRGRADRDPSPANLFDLGYLHALGLDPERDRAANARASVSAWERALALGDPDALTLAKLAEAYAGLARWPEARRASEKLLALVPGDRGALEALAAACDACGAPEDGDRVRWQRVDGALAEIEPWVALVEGWGRRVRGVADADAHRAALEAGIAARGGPAAHGAAGQVALGWAHLLVLGRAPGEDDAIRALARFEEAVEANAAGPWAHWGMARAQSVLVALGRTGPEVAIAACEEAARRHPELARAHAELGDALLCGPGRGLRSEAAAGSFQRALQLDPHHVWSHHRLAELARDAGALAEARRHARYVLALAPDTALASAATDLLAS